MRCIPKLLPSRQRVSHLAEASRGRLTICQLRSLNSYTIHKCANSHKTATDTIFPPSQRQRGQQHLPAPQWRCRVFRCSSKRIQNSCLLRSHIRLARCESSPCTPTYLHERRAPVRAHVKSDLWQHAKLSQGSTTRCSAYEDLANDYIMPLPGDAGQGGVEDGKGGLKMYSKSEEN